MKTSSFNCAQVRVIAPFGTVSPKQYKCTMNILRKVTVYFSKKLNDAEKMMEIAGNNKFKQNILTWKIKLN